MLLQAAVDACKLRRGKVTLYSFRYAFYHYMCKSGGKVLAARGLGHNNGSGAGEGFYARDLEGDASGQRRRGDKPKEFITPSTCEVLHARAAGPEQRVRAVDVAAEVDAHPEVVAAMRRVPRDNAADEVAAAVRRRVEAALIKETEVVLRASAERKVWGHYTYHQRQGVGVVAGSGLVPSVVVRMRPAPESTTLAELALAQLQREDRTWAGRILSAVEMDVLRDLRVPTNAEFASLHGAKRDDRGLACLHGWSTCRHFSATPRALWEHELRHHRNQTLAFCRGCGIALRTFGSIKNHLRTRSLACVAVSRSVAVSSASGSAGSGGGAGTGGGAADGAPGPGGQDEQAHSSCVGAASAVLNAAENVAGGNATGASDASLRLLR